MAVFLTVVFVTYPKRVFKFPLLSVVCVILAIEMMTGIVSLVPSLALSRVIYYALTGAAVGLMAFVALRSSSEVGTYWRIATIAGALSAGYGIVEFCIGENFFWGSTFSQGNFLYARFASDSFGKRILSTVGHPVYLGTVLAGLLPLSLHYAVSDEGVARKFSLSILILISLGLILTFARGAYLAAAIGLLVYAWKLSARARLNGLIVLGTVVIVALSFSTVRDTLLGRNTLEQLSEFRSDQRGIAYRQATQLLLKAPLTGHGLGHYRYLAKEPLDYNQTTDNMYLRILVESGVAGFCAVVYLIVKLSGHLIHASRRLPDLLAQRLSLAVLSSLVAFLVDMTTCDALYFPLTRYLFWAICGSGLALYALSTEKEGVKAV
jgi:hypothetical protein